MVKKEDLTDISALGFNKSIYPRTHYFLDSQDLVSYEKLESRWRIKNLILKVSSEWQNYVVKRLDMEQGETNKVKMMRQTYPSITPELFLIEGSHCYIMGHIPGKSFFDLRKAERVKKIKRAGKLLAKVYSEVGEDCSKVNINREVMRGFERYRKNRKEFFNDDELNLTRKDFEIFRTVPNQLSHNDLNAANLLYNGEIRVIDPSEEGYNDVARDVGRYCASCFFNNYDYFGNDKEHSLAIAKGFLENFDEYVLERARYYIGESFLSFLNFNTKTTDKSVLKKLAMRLLTGKGEILNLLEEGLE